MNADRRRRPRRLTRPPAQPHRHDPLGFVDWAFPWGVADGPLAHHTGPEKWQADVLRQDRRRPAEGGRAR